MGGEIKVFVISWHCKKNKCSNSLECCLSGCNCKGREKPFFMNGSAFCLMLEHTSCPNPCSEGHTRSLLPVKSFHEWNLALLSHLSSRDLSFTSECFGWLWLSRITVHEWNVKSSMALLNWLKKKKKSTQQTFGNRAQEACEAAWAIWQLI